MKQLASVLLVVGIAGVVSSSAYADPIDNPDTADFIWYNNPGSPFLEFATGEDIYSYKSGGPASKFRADVDAFGDMDFISSSTQYYPTSITINGYVNVKVVITDVVGTTDCTDAPDGGDCEVDWDTTAQLWFNGGPTSEATCKTSSFTISMTGTWDDTTSAAFTVPALSGSGSQACGGLASFMNSYWGFGTSGATLSLYKYETDTFGGGTLVGSP